MIEAEDDERCGPNELARVAEGVLAELVPLRDAEKDKDKRAALNLRIRSTRIMLNFARSRAGYVASN